MLFRKNNLSNIGKNIKEYRLKEGLKQTELAEELGMNYQNYSKMERGVYTPSLEKLMEICKTLGMTPNDLLLEGREFDDFKQEIIEGLDNSVLDIMDTMKIVEEMRARAMIAKENGDEKLERQELEQIIGIYAWRNEHYWEIADFLYYKKIDGFVKKVSSRTCKEFYVALKNETVPNFV